MSEYDLAQPIDRVPAESWYASRSVGDGVVMITEPWLDPLISANIFVVLGSERVLVVDFGCGLVPLMPVVAATGWLHRPIVAVATHADFDHVGAMHEFETRLIHASEAHILEEPPEGASLYGTDYAENERRYWRSVGYEVPDRLFSALPEGFDPKTYRIAPSPATRQLADGERISLGDRTFEVLHTPGHSVGGVCLWEEESGALFTGDTVYDGPLIDRYTGVDQAVYAASMRRIAALPAKHVYTGHEEPVDGRRLLEIIDAYLDGSRPSLRNQ